jgi:hypothetical protein
MIIDEATESICLTVFENVPRFKTLNRARIA